MKARDKRPIAQLLGAVTQGGAASTISKKLQPQAAELQQQSRTWLRYKGIQGLGIGYKRSANRNTGVPCLKVYVASKRSKSRLRDPAPVELPALSGGGQIPVDVEEIGQLRLHAGPVYPGASVAHKTRSAGTLGMVVQPRDNGPERYLLSCHHVLAPLDPDDRSTAIRHPAPDDGGASDYYNVAHYLYSFPLFNDAVGYPNIADAALAELKPGIDWYSELPMIGEPSGWTDQINEDGFVLLHGRTSELDSGVIMDTDFYTELVHSGPGGARWRYRFGAQVLCSPYGDPGDSGAAILNERRQVIGLHIGGSSQRSIFSPIRPIFDYFQVDLASRDGAHGAAPAATPPVAPAPVADGTYATAALTGLHSVFGSVPWRLTASGLEVEGAVNGTPGALQTVPRVWQQFGPAIRQAAREFSVPAELIIACLCTESGGNPAATREEPGYVNDRETPSRVSAGMLQTLISTAREALGDTAIDRSWLLQPQNSIRAGTAYIKRQQFITRYDPPKVACAYNAGGVYENRGINNRWKMRQYPIGSGKHADRFIMWFNDVFRYFAQLPASSIPADSFFAEMNL
ncbi:transglycosylase SLT domain-containing protein [Halioglobus pacificus]|uniref:Transglycosylase SLT domain-containing protein n=1 Tax=Parahalioglobus pacificus TaxID=930806 RepID=A0A918XD73_9GAMM|nr:transglycosylase SLT domain-containing protein [Halioglobus pacificus]GHD25478.1 hypothetical protein GCM10007053_01310 [Halioglobus pacificus]